MNFQDACRIKFGRYKILKELSHKPGEKRMVLCRCSCGIEKIVRLTHLWYGKIKSCGCLASEINSKRKTTHGKSNTRIYKIWVEMIKRTTNPKVISYKNYGARGIRVCKRWQKFENFYEDMLPTYSKNLSIERNDNNLDYSLENCRWASLKEQARNKRNTLKLTINNETKPLIKWAEERNLPYKRVYKRIYKFNWSPRVALEIP